MSVSWNVCASMKKHNAPVTREERARHIFKRHRFTAPRNYDHSKGRTERVVLLNGTIMVIYETVEWRLGPMSSGAEHCSI